MDPQDSHIAETTSEFDPALSLTHTLREAARHGERAVLLCSFQKEESVLLDELLRLGEEMNPGHEDENPTHPVRVVTIDTGVLFEETLQTWRAFEERFGIKIEVQDARAGGTESPWSGPEHCCSSAKVAALESSLAGAEAWITGIRREQGPTRANTELIERDQGRGLWKYNPLHDQGYESIGCAPCTQPGSGREGRWAGTSKTECGIHVVEPVR
jgi:phosphoadenosine phosphosulfate reductase